MTIIEMRKALINRYSGRIRNERVDEMPDAQVYAIYRSLEARRDLEPKKKPFGKPIGEQVHYEQLRMDI